MHRPSLSLLSLVLLPIGARGQSPADILRAPARTIKASDLPETLRAVSIGDGLSNGAFATVQMSAYGRSDTDPRASLFFRLIGTTFVDPEEFEGLLAGKRARIEGYTLNVAATMKGDSGRDSRIPEPFFAPVWIEGGRIFQWTPLPDLTRASILAAPEAPVGPSPALKSQALSNAKQVALAVLQYSMDYDDVYPLADSTPRAQKIVLPYLKDGRLWTSPQPEGGRLVYNTALSGLASTSLDRIAETPLIWDEKPWPDGSRIVGFADGHVKVARPEDWEGTIWAYELRRRAAAKPKGVGMAVPKPLTGSAPAVRRP